MNYSFLKAEWRKLLMINYLVDPGLIFPWLPVGTGPDLCNGRCYLSLVGFMFLNTRVKGVKIPFHVNFEEVNLRFYVRRKSGNEWRSGVVFIRETVPLPLLALTANLLYKERYKAMPMHHRWYDAGPGQLVGYDWKMAGQWHSIQIQAGSKLYDCTPGTEEEFITARHWGYTRLNDKSTLEYEVKHPPWRVYKTLDHEVKVDFGCVYGELFQFLNTRVPASVFLAEGSAVEVSQGRKIC